MRFYFDIDDAEFEDEYGMNFRQAVKAGAIDAVAEQICDHETDLNRWYSEVKKQIDELIKSKQGDICEMIVERVAEKIANKKAIVAITPKASEIAAADKDNIAYFEQMIDRAIAKRFGK